jgi:chemotaxis family two-component system sensor kinase Cph1
MIRPELEPIECDLEPIHLSGHIQPHGILIVLKEPDLKILQISANVDSYFGFTPESLLGKNLSALFSKTQTKRIFDYSQQENLDVNNPFELKVRINHSDQNSTFHFQKFHGILHRNKSNILILELEPYVNASRSHNSHSHKSIEIYHLLQGFMARMRQINTLAEFAQLLASKVKEINGFDRVMVYRFDPITQVGIVIAEDKEPQLDSYLGLHYPASDIPQKARQIFSQNWVRFIPNVSYQDVPIIPSNHPITGEPLDLTYAGLRSVAAGHIEYLENMEVGGAMSISIRNEHRLWGLIACHNYTPKYIDYKTRKACEFFGQFASIELLRQQEIETTRYQVHVKSIQEELCQAFSGELGFVQQALEHNRNKLLDLVCAQGAAILLDDCLTLIGKTPSRHKVKVLINWFIEQNPQPPEIFVTNALPDIYPHALQMIDSASGIAIASIVIKQKCHHIIWFRPEQFQTVNWAGASRNPISIAENGEHRYTPRQSFKLWIETVRHKSLPWQPLEIEAALEMRRILMQAILDSAQLVLERNAELEKTVTEAEIANRAKSEFLAKMSHELRTPLTAILGFTHLISRDHSLVKTHQEHLDIISRSGEHLLSLINDVLEISKIESGQVDLTESSFDLYRLLYSIRDMFAVKASNKGIELHLDIASKVPQYVYGDAAKLRQILLNIVGNAIKFTLAGYVRMRVSAEPILPNIDNIASNTQVWKLSFEVEDTGSGISDDDLKIIFDTFKQTAQGRFLQGSGLGLSISRQFARLMAGDVTVRSKFGKGSIFLCQVQLVEVEANVVTNLKEPQLVISLKSGQPNYRILIVEDVLEIRQLLVNLLESIGLDVYAAENGQEAIAIYQECLPHLIWMDICMPIMDGYEATRQIRAMPEGQNTKIIALTASAFEADRLASLNAGCDDFVAKPFTEATVFEKIANFLGLEYIYAETLPLNQYRTSQPSNLVKPLQKTELGDLGEEFLKSLSQAALLLDEETLYELIAHIPPEHKSIAQALTMMVNNLQFESILELTQT